MGVRSQEIRDIENGRSEHTFRTNDQAIYRLTFDAQGKLTDYMKLDSPSKLKEDDLPKATKEVARLIQKSRDNFGNDFDRDYIAEVYRAHRRVKFGGRNFVEQVNKALEVESKPYRYEIDYWSVRDNSDDAIWLRDRSSRRKGVSEIVVPK